MFGPRGFVKVLNRGRTGIKLNAFIRTTVMFVGRHTETSRPVEGEEEAAEQCREASLEGGGDSGGGQRGRKRQRRPSPSPSPSKSH